MRDRKLIFFSNFMERHFDPMLRSASEARRDLRNKGDSPPFVTAGND